MLSWGIPTTISAVEVAEKIKGIDLIVSGGVRSALDIVKAIALGSSAVGIATPVLRMLLDGGVEEGILKINRLLHDVRRYMLLVGAGNLEELQSVPFIISGHSREWLTARKIDITKFATRNIKRSCAES
jgi:isopentenyl-diphosphate delta-isomerase